MYYINKLNLLVSLIVVEVITIVILLGILFFDSGIKSTHTQVITITQSSLIYSSDDNTIPYTGRMQDTLCSKVIVEYDVVDGFKEGEFLMLTMDGNFAVKGFMKRNKNHGAWKYYYDTGELECAGLFNNDQPTGMWKWYYNSGVKKCEGNYINGQADGIWMYYDETGLPVMLINYRAGDVISSVNINTIKKV